MKFAALLLALPLCAAPWLRTEADGIVVLSDAGASVTRETLLEALRMRSVFVQITGGRVLSPVTLRLFVFRSSADYESYRPVERAAGFFETGVYSDFVAAPSGPLLRRTLRHELTHAFLAYAGLSRALWLDEGMAELFSTATLAGKEARIGEPPPGYLEGLRSSGLVPLADLIRNDRPAYAQSWAFVHMLVFSRAYAGVLPAYAKSGALQIAPGTDRDLRQYVDAGNFRTVGFPLPPLVDASSTSSKLSVAQAAVALAELALASGRKETARKVLAAAGGSSDPAVETALAEVAMSQGDDIAARKHLDRAMGMGAPSGRLLSDIAMLDRDRGVTETQVAEQLRAALKVDAKLFDAHLLLGTWALRDGRRSEAVIHLEAAQGLRPYRLDVREQLIDARVEKSMPLPAKDVADAPPARVKVRGSLVAVDCLEGAARLRIRSGGENAFVLLRRGITGAPLELPCGEVAQKRAVEIEHDGKPDAVLGTAGVVLTLDFH